MIEVYYDMYTNQHVIAIVGPHGRAEFRINESYLVRMSPDERQRVELVLQEVLCLLRVVGG